MSRTYKDKSWKYREEIYRFMYGRSDEFPYLLQPYVKRKVAKEIDNTWHFTRSQPAWFRRMFINRPQRARYRRMDKKIYSLLNLEDYDHVDLRKKPFVYYW